MYVQYDLIPLFNSNTFFYLEFNQIKQIISRLTQVLNFKQFVTY